MRDSLGLAGPLKLTGDSRSFWGAAQPRERSRASWRRLRSNGDLVPTVASSAEQDSQHS